MAVYTKINLDILSNLLKKYEIGQLTSFEPIYEGVENTNYKIITSNNTYILTIFEKRVKKNDLPFFINLKNHLSKKNFQCPKPIENKIGEYIDSIKEKPCIIVSFLNGKKTSYITEENCEQLGNQISIMHNITLDLNISRENYLSQKYWREIFEGFRKFKKDKYNSLYKKINLELIFLKNNWPTNLASGIIHADVFQDNVFFKNGTFSGLIDFYFACNDYYAFELAICINAWCFSEKVDINTKNLSIFLNSYQKHRKLSNNEKNSLPILLRGAAMRFLLTRLHDLIFHNSNDYVEPKDPIEYLKILEFHQNYNCLKNIEF